MKDDKRNINDNDRFNEPFANDNDGKKDHSYVESKAEYLVRKLNAEDSYKQFCYLLYRLPEQTIDSLVETAQAKGRNPTKLFIFLARREIRRRGK